MNDLSSSLLRTAARSSQNDAAANPATCARSLQNNAAENPALFPLVGSQNDVARSQVGFPPLDSQNDVAGNQVGFALLDWKRAHAELVALAHKQTHLDTKIGRWLLYARRAVTHAWLGYASVNEYAEQLFGFTPRQTQERLRVAEALEELPMLESAFEQGTLCWSAVRELTRVTTPETESEWLAAVRGRTARQIEQMVKGHGRGHGPQDRVNAASVQRVLRFELSPTTYATVQEALTKIRRDAGGRIDDDEALLLMARHVLGGPTDEGRSSYQIAISMCPTCERAFQHARGELVELSAAAVEAARCDAQHIGAVRATGGAATHMGAGAEGGGGGAEGEGGSECQRGVEREGGSEHEHGGGERGERGSGRGREGGREGGRERRGTWAANRTKQNLPPSIRRLVLRRARKQCEVPTCTNGVFLDVHHRTPRSEGGTHDENELVALCGAHHTAIHEGRLLIEGDAAGGWTFRHADGAGYGASPCAQEVDLRVKVFRGLRSLGFKEGEARRALDHVARQPHVGTALTAERLLREALGVLSHPSQHS